MTARVALLAATSLPWHRYGGLERHVFDLCRWLRKRGTAVDLFLSTPEHAAHPFAGDEGFRLRVIPGTPFVRARFAVVPSRITLYPLFSLRMGREAALVASRGEYAAVIAQGLTGLGYAVHAPRVGARAPLILNPQGMEEALTPSILKRAAYTPFRALTRFAARRAAAVVATDRVLVPAVESILGVPADRVLVIPNAVDVDQCLAEVDPALARDLLSRLDVETASPRIVTVGRLAPNKGFEVGVRALAEMSPRLPPAWCWIIVGDGPLRTVLERAVGEHGLARHVRLAGKLTDRELHTLLAEADLFLNPTLYEGSSLVTLEAMSHGCAIVASRAGGIPDKIEEGETGWLAEPGDARSLVSAIARWLGTAEAERARVGQRAAARCSERFDWPVCVDRYLEAIERLSRP